jgi:tetratricopeptide (TPR) repeat protein
MRNIRVFQKNILTFLLAAVIFVPCVSFAAEPLSFAEANLKYQAGDFEAAAQGYEKAVASGRASGAVYYNLGNARFRLGEKGKALLAYERALKKMPRDKDLRWNLVVLQSTIPDHIEPSPENALPTTLLTLTGYITTGESAALLTAFLALWFLAVLLGFLVPGALFWTRLARPFILICLAVSAGLFAFKWSDTRDPRAVILQKEVYARYGPSEKETKAFLLHEGAQAIVQDESKDWVYIALPNKNAGWIPKRSCEVI